MAACIYIQGMYLQRHIGKRNKHTHTQNTFLNNWAIYKSHCIIVLLDENTIVYACC